MDFKEQIERVLTAELRKLHPQLSNVTVSFDGQFAIYHLDDRYMLRKLSKGAREFLRKGGDVAAVEKSLFES